MIWLKRFVFIGVMILPVVHHAHASVNIAGSRVVYDAGKKEVSLSVNNPQKKTAYLIQTWVDNESEDNTAKTPFIITPPLFRLDPGEENILRIVSTARGLPVDRETVYWMNIKAIPSVEESQKSRLLISVNTRIKLFWRPQGLAGNPDDAYRQLSFNRQATALRVTNPTPYYVSFRELKVGGKAIADAGMVPPKGEVTLPLTAGMSGKISWTAINDFGGTTDEATQS